LWSESPATGCPFDKRFCKPDLSGLDLALSPIDSNRSLTGEFYGVPLETQERRSEGAGLGITVSGGGLYEATMELSIH
jgi:hypothetical protein